MKSVRRRVPALLLVALAGLLAACGGEREIVTHAETEGIFVNVGPLDYQVQISRALNPAAPDDAAYLVGVPSTVPAPTREETWFAIFLRVENNGEAAALSADDVEIVDTLEKVYRPIEFEDENVFAYRPTTLEPDDALPRPNSAASSSPIQGSLMLFKVTLDSLANRPLELRIKAPDGSGAVGVVNLDV